VSTTQQLAFSNFYRRASHNFLLVLYQTSYFYWHVHPYTKSKPPCILWQVQGYCYPPKTPFYTFTLLFSLCIVKSYIKEYQQYAHVMHTFLVQFYIWLYNAQWEQQYKDCGCSTGKNYQPSQYVHIVGTVLCLHFIHLVNKYIYWIFLDMLHNLSFFLQKWHVFHIIFFWFTKLSYFTQMVHKNLNV